jgi:hypothetical protein
VNAGSGGASLLKARICGAFLLSVPSYGASADNSLHAVKKSLVISMSTQMQPRVMLLLATQYTAFAAKQELWGGPPNPLRSAEHGNAQLASARPPPNGVMGLALVGYLIEYLMINIRLTIIRGNVPMGSILLASNHSYIIAFHLLLPVDAKI